MERPQGNAIGKTRQMPLFAHNPRDAVSALGEERLLAQMRRWLGPVAPPSPFGMGDDCAVLPAVQGRPLMTVDPVVYRRHFDDHVPPTAVGAKLLKRNLSDIAAMGGRPVAAVLALTLDARVSRRWLEGFYRGLADCARRHRVAVVGGDISEGDDTFVASLTLLGKRVGTRYLTRTGARIGDSLWVTGRLGRTLRSGHHLDFVPRLAEGAWLARRREVRAMMDVSDGLAKDVHALTPPGGAAALNADAIPRRVRASLREALCDGEDHELLIAVARRADSETLARAWRRAFPRTRLSCIGSFVPAGRQPAEAIDLRKYHGYEHLR